MLVADKPRQLSFAWQVSWGDFAKEKDSRVTFTIEPAGDRVKLTLVHDEFEEGSKLMAQMDRGGWPPILAGLKKTLEEHAAAAP